MKCHISAENKKSATLPAKVIFLDDNTWCLSGSSLIHLKKKSNRNHRVVHQAVYYILEFRDE